MLIALLLVICLADSGLCAEKQHVYSTWETMDFDKLVSLWFIIRFRDPEAIFQFYPKGSLKMAGTEIDTPLSRFRRTQRLTAYETMLKVYKVSDPRLLYIGRLVHDIEINIWQRKALPETQGIDLVFTGIILTTSTNPQKCLTDSLVVLDALYEGLKARHWENGRR